MRIREFRLGAGLWLAGNGSTLFKASALAVVGVVVFAASTHFAHAQSVEEQVSTRDYDIPAGPLSTALSRFAAEAGVLLSVDASLTQNKNSSGLRGRYGLREGFTQLLSGTNLEAVQASDGYALKRLPPPPEGATALPAVSVTAELERLPDELPPVYSGGQVARGSRQGMLGNTDIFETPFSTKAYTAELIRNQGARSINDVVENDPSIRTSLSATGPLDQSSIRGFISNGDGYLFDGIQGLVSYSSIAVQNFERIEVLKGPSAGLAGAGAGGTAIGGSFNMVPKRATDEPVRSITLSARDESLLGVHADFGQRFGRDKAFGVRLNVSAEDGTQFNESDRRLLAPLLALDYRGETVRVVLDAGSVSYQSTAASGNRPLQAGATLPTAPNPRTNSLAPWETLHLDQTFGLLTTEWDFTDRWTAYVRSGLFFEEPSKRIYLNQSALDSNGGFLVNGYSSYLWKQDNQVSEIGSRGMLTLGQTSHTLAFSVLQDREEYHDERFFSQNYEIPIQRDIYTESDISNPFVDGVPDVPGSDYTPTYITSFAAADTIKMLEDRLQLTLAARRQTIKVKPYEKSRVTPTVAALYQFGRGISIYSNYAEALAQGETAPDTAANPGEQLPPYVSKQHEFGVKWNLGTYGLTLAYFDIKKAFALIDDDNVFRAGGQQQNQGVELETFGEPLKGFRLLGGVAWIDAEQSDTQDGATDGNKAIGVPEFTTNLGAELDIAAVQGLTLTGRFIHTDSAYIDLINTQKVPDWNRVDAGARYRLAVAGHGLILRTGINNLLNDRYWTIGGRNFISVAPPRTWQLSATYDF